MKLKAFRQTVFSNNTIDGFLRIKTTSVRKQRQKEKKQRQSERKKPLRLRITKASKEKRRGRQRKREMFSRHKMRLQHPIFSNNLEFGHQIQKRKPETNIFVAERSFTRSTKWRVFFPFARRKRIFIGDRAEATVRNFTFNVSFKLRSDIKKKQQVLIIIVWNFFSFAFATTTFFLLFFCNTRGYFHSLRRSYERIVRIN